MKKILIKNATIVNEGKIFVGDVLIEGERIERIDSDISVSNAEVIDATGKHLMPGVIDDQVHFREPGLTHKATIATESRAAVAGGVTSFMEMPNTKPPALTQELLEEKYEIAKHTSAANYSFFMGASNDNAEEVLKTNPKNICGIKIFMGSSTGNMLVDNEKTLESIFKNAPILVATHCEDEATIRRNEEEFRKKYGEEIPVEMHPLIRNEEACYKSSSMAVEMAKQFGTRLHILHISTAKELELFRNDIPLREKKITAEVCVHYLWFSADDYARLGNKIKCNPAIKEKSNREALMKGLLENKLDIIATDHAPHTWEEKNNSYFKAPSGLPLIQHSLNIMLEYFKRGYISLERIAEKMCHAPAECFQIAERGFIREGYFADLVLVDLNSLTPVPFPDERVKNPSIYPELFYKCGWSPLEGETFHSKIIHTFVSGNLIWADGKINEEVKGQRMMFKR